MAMSQVLIHVINPQSFHWSMQTRIPWSLLAAIVALFLVSATATARISGRGALSGSVIRAVCEDW
jgi:putative ABC transport system permease protein